MSFNHEIKEYFNFNRGERKGILILLAIIILVIAINQNIGLIIKDEPFDKVRAQSVIDQFDEFNKVVYDSKNIKDNELKGFYDSANLFHFDPNNTSQEDFIKLGLSEKQSKTILNYLSKGGRFKYRSDFKKIYGISQDRYLQLYPYIDLPESDADLFENDYVENTQYDKNQKSEPFYFDPNTISNQEWMELGFSEKQTASIRNYINKGGKFVNKEDLKKLYVVSDEKYEELKDYIRIISINEPEQDSENETVVIDLNNFSKDDFVNLGEEWVKIAGRIINFRDLLGGFSRKEQLNEVYGLNKSLYNSVSENLYIDNSVIEKININFAETSELSKHPYLSYEDARKITEYRDKKGSYKSVDELFEKGILNNETFEKIFPYLIVK